MALGSFVAGRYSGTYNAVDVGMTRDGYEVEQDADIDEIGETDAWGASVIDGIWRGGNCFMQFNSEEYKAGSLGAFWPYGNAVAAGAGVLGTLLNTAGTTPIGTLASVLAKSMVLTVTPGTPAVGTVNTLTALLALLAKNYNGKLLFTSKLREVPVRLRLYPGTTGGITSFFTTT